MVSTYPSTCHICIYQKNRTQECLLYGVMGSSNNGIRHMHIKSFNTCDSIILVISQITCSAVYADGYLTKLKER